VRSGMSQLAPLCHSAVLWPRSRDAAHDDCRRQLIDAHRRWTCCRTCETSRQHAMSQRRRLASVRVRCACHFLERPTQVPLSTQPWPALLSRPRARAGGDADRTHLAIAAQAANLTARGEERRESTRQRLKASGWRGIELGPVEVLLNAVKGFFANLAPRAQAVQCRALGGDRA
jgi:hypothetical protein